MFVVAACNKQMYGLELLYPSPNYIFHYPHFFVQYSCRWHKEYIKHNTPLALSLAYEYMSTAGSNRNRNRNRNKQQSCRCYSSQLFLVF